MDEQHTPETLMLILSYLFNCFFIHFMIYFMYWDYFYFKYLLVLFTLRVEFLLKTESGYLRDAEVTQFTLVFPSL